MSQEEMPCPNCDTPMNQPNPTEYVCPECGTQVVIDDKSTESGDKDETR